MLGTGGLLLSDNPDTPPDVEYVIQQLIIVSICCYSVVQVTLPKLILIWKGERVLVSKLVSDHHRKQREKKQARRGDDASVWTAAQMGPSEQTYSVAGSAYDPANHNSLGSMWSSQRHVMVDFLNASFNSSNDNSTLGGNNCSDSDSSNKNSKSINVPRSSLKSSTTASQRFGDSLRLLPIGEEEEVSVNECGGPDEFLNEAVATVNLEMCESGYTAVSALSTQSSFGMMDSGSSLFHDPPSERELGLAGPFGTPSKQGA